MLSSLAPAVLALLGTKLVLSAIALILVVVTDRRARRGDPRGSDRTFACVVATLVALGALAFGSGPFDPYPVVLFDLVLGLVAAAVVGGILLALLAEGDL